VCVNLTTHNTVNGK